MRQKIDYNIGMPTQKTSKHYHAVPFLNRTDKAERDTVPSLPLCVHVHEPISAFGSERMHAAQTTEEIWTPPSGDTGTPFAKAIDNRGNELIVVKSVAEVE